MQNLKWSLILIKMNSVKAFLPRIMAECHWLIRIVKQFYFFFQLIIDPIAPRIAKPHSKNVPLNYFWEIASRIFPQRLFAERFFK